MFIDFLANNYFWFLVITIVLIFALIGYVADTKIQKKLDSYQVENQDLEKRYEALARSASNQTIGEMVSKSSQINLVSKSVSSNETNQSPNLNHNPFLQNPQSQNLEMPVLNSNQSVETLEILGK